MYLLGVKPWESASYVVPSLEEMSGKVRKRVEEGNPELRVEKEENLERGDRVGVNGARDGEGLRAEEREGSEEGLREKKEGEA